MFKKMICVLLVVTMALCVCAGCVQKKNENQETTVPATDTTGANPEETEESADARKEAETV